MTDVIAYPPPPWHLHGESVQAVRLVSIELARSWVSPRLKIVPVAPGMTLAAVFCAKYGSSSTLRYHELAVAPALTRIGNRVGFWISHIYVDSPQSVAGGREIWGLPKELAEFHWRGSGAVDIVQGAERLCSLEWSAFGPRLPAPLFLPLLSERNAELLAFHGRGTGRVRLCRGSVNIAQHAPFAPIGPGHSWHMAEARIRLKVSAPRA